MYDPTTLNRQGNDRGTQYRSAIFTLSSEQEATATRIKEKVNTSGKWKNPVVTEITKASKFTPKLKTITKTIWSKPRWDIPVTIFAMNNPSKSVVLDKAFLYPHH